MILWLVQYYDNVNTGLNIILMLILHAYMTYSPPSFRLQLICVFFSVLNIGFGRNRVNGFSK
jgi:hypothetical protein